MILSDLAARISTEIKTALPDLATCAPAPGRFDLRALRALGNAGAPAVRVAVLGIDRGREVGGPAWEHAVQLAAYVVTTDRPPLARDAAALAIVETLLPLVWASPWRGEDLGSPESVAADNLYSEGTQERGVALWAVAWRQPVQLGPRPDHAGAIPAAWYVGGLEPDGGETVIGGAA